MIKVSVIVPVYNVEKYLRGCLGSLVGQTLHGLEVIVVNDGSTDGSQQIIDEFAQKYPFIKSFVKENGGLSDARNFGLRHAVGEYIGFVDSDDTVAAQMFAEMYSLAERHNAGMVICNLQKVDETGKVRQKLPQIPQLPERVVLEEHFSAFSDLSYFACNKIFRKDLFNGIRFKKGVHFEDIQLIPQLLLQCETIAHTNEYFYNYLERTDSITRTHTAKGLDILHAVEEVTAAFEQSKYAHKTRELRNFQILEGVYTFLAYLALVKDDTSYRMMSAEFKKYRAKYGLSLLEILRYQRFEKNYLLYLPTKKKIYYLLYFLKQEKLLRKLLHHRS